MPGAATLVALAGLAVVDAERLPDASGRRRFTPEELAACICPPLEEQMATGEFVLYANCPTHGEKGPQP